MVEMAYHSHDEDDAEHDMDVAGPTSWSSMLSEEQWLNVRCSARTRSPTR